MSRNMVISQKYVVIFFKDASGNSMLSHLGKEIPGSQISGRLYVKRDCRCWGDHVDTGSCYRLRHVDATCRSHAIEHNIFEQFALTRLSVLSGHTL